MPTSGLAGGASGTPTRADAITANYGGDTTHADSSGTTTVTVRPSSKADCRNAGWQNYGFQKAKARASSS